MNAFSNPTLDDDEFRRLFRFDRIRPRGRDALRHHHGSVVRFGASGYRGVAAMIACAWVEPLTGANDEERLRQRQGGTGREDEADGRQLVLGGGVLVSLSEVSKPICIAKRTISFRVRRPSFSAIRARYVSTVFTLTRICFAISWLP